MLRIYWCECGVVNAMLWLLDGDNDLTRGKKSSLGNKSSKMVKVNAMLVFAVIVGEQDTCKKVNAVLVFAVIVGEQDTSKR